MTNTKQEAKTIAKHSFVYGAGAVLNKVIGFLMIPLYTRFLSPSDYGVMQLIVLTADVVGMVISVGIASSMYRFYFEYNSEAERNEVVSTAIISFGVIALTALSFVSLFSRPLSFRILNSNDYWYYFLITFSSLWFNTMADISYSYLRIKEKSTSYLLFSLTKLIIALALNIYLVAVAKLGVLGILLSTLISSIVINLVLTIPLLVKIKTRFSMAKCKEMLKYGAPFIPTNLAAFVVHASDRFFVKHYVGLAATGIYSLAYKFGTLPNDFVASPFMQIWEVRFLDSFKKKNASQLFGQMFTYLCFALFFVGLAISVLVKDALIVMSDRSYWEAYKVVPVVIISYIVFSFQYYFNMGIYFEKKTKYLAYINGSNATLNVILNLLFIKAYGIWGAAFATLACFVYKVIVTYIVSNRLYKISIETARILKLCLTAAGLYILCSAVSLDSVYLDILVKSGAICLFPIIVYFFNFYTAQEKSTLKIILTRPSYALAQIFGK
jgi:O-antigen/teichoic acid export membrane protein